jgi:hypothetical protein
LAEYYKEIFPKLSPYVKDHLLTLERCPDGMQGECFFQKQKPKAMPPGTPTKRIAHVGKTGKFTDYVVGGSLRTQLRLVNLGCIAVHVMASRADSPRQPDWLCIDIDPESGRFGDAARAGLRVKAGLDCQVVIPPFEAADFRLPPGRMDGKCQDIPHRKLCPPVPACEEGVESYQLLWSRASIAFLGPSDQAQLTTRRLRFSHDLRFDGQCLNAFGCAQDHPNPG